MYDKDNLSMTLGEVLANAGKKQSELPKPKIPACNILL